MEKFADRPEEVRKMIFWFFLILTLIGASLIAYDCKKVPMSDIPMIVGWILSIICGVITAVLLLVIVCNNANLEGQRLAAEEQYKALVYKARTEACRDEFGIINKEFIDEIQAWNMNCVRLKAKQDDFWFGIFVPDIYDDLKPIDLQNIKYREGGKE